MRQTDVGYKLGFKTEFGIRNNIFPIKEEIRSNIHCLKTVLSDLKFFFQSTSIHYFILKQSRDLSNELKYHILFNQLNNTHYCSKTAILLFVNCLFSQI